jgi:hypothetical protein
VSRPPSAEEHWTLYYFETHAISCQPCKSGLRLTKATGDLCEKGSELARDVVSLELSMNSEDVICAPREAESPSTKTQSRRKSKTLEVRVEIPFNYKYSRRLLRALAISNDLAFISGRNKTKSDPLEEDSEQVRRNSDLLHGDSQTNKRPKHSNKKKASKSSRGRPLSKDTFTESAVDSYDSYQTGWDATFYFSAATTS